MRLEEQINRLLDSNIRLIEALENYAVGIMVGDHPEGSKLRVEARNEFAATRNFLEVNRKRIDQEAYQATKQT